MKYGFQEGDITTEPGSNMLPSEQSVNKDELVKFVNDEFKRRQDERKAFEIQWRLNQAFIEGNQYLEINPTTLALQEIPKINWWQEREVFNHVGPIVETRVAKLSRMRPVLKCRPGSGEQSDIRASKVGSQLLMNTYNDNGVREKMGEAYQWAEACGSVLFKNIWNPKKGKPLMQLIGMDGMPETVTEGDLEVIMVPAPEIFPDSSYRQDVPDCKSLIHAKAFAIEEIEEIHGKKIAPEDSTVIQMQQSKTGMGGLGYGQGGFKFNTIKLQNHAIVKEYYRNIVTGKQIGRAHV